MIGKMVIATTLPGFNDLGHSVTPTFLFRNIFYLQLSPRCPKMNKKSMWEGEKKLKIKFNISVHGTSSPAILQLPRETVISKYELVLQGTSQVDCIQLIGPLKQYLAEKISLQRSKCN